MEAGGFKKALENNTKCQKLNGEYNFQEITFIY